MQATRPRPQSPQDKSSIHPVVVIAIGAAAVLAALLVNLFHSPSREDAATASTASHGLKLGDVQGARVQGAGWVTRSAAQEAEAIQAGSVQPHAGPPVRVLAAGENSGKDAGSPGDAEQDATTGAPGGKGVVAQPFK